MAKNEETILTTIHPDQQDDEYLSTQEAAEFMKMANITIRTMLSDGRLTRYKFKSLTLVSKKELLSMREKS